VLERIKLFGKNKNTTKQENSKLQKKTKTLLPHSSNL